MTKLYDTAPERIWLQVSDDDDHDEPFPENIEDVTWCATSTLTTEVAYDKALHWTTEVPTDPGWYWVRHNEWPYPAVGLVMRAAFGELVLNLPARATSLDTFAGEAKFAGPIQQPEEAAK